MVTTVLGLDPGQKGGIGILRDGLIRHVEPMPILNKLVDVNALDALLGTWNIDLVIIEQQTIRPMQKGAMSIGANYGRLCGMVELHALPHRIVTPATWNRKAGIAKGLTGRPKKEASYAAALRTWGQAFKDTGLTVSKDGQYEALLIARYGQ